jgi:hypothetical protein
MCKGYGRVVVAVGGQEQGLMGLRTDRMTGESKEW